MRRQLTIEETLELLALTPERIRELTTGLTPAQLRRRPKRGEWSANEVLAHIRACADVRGDVIPTILAQKRPTVRAVDPRSYMLQTNYLELEFRRSFRAFTRQRAALLACLRSLPRSGWQRSTTVTGAGAVLTRSVHTYARWVARHERPHVKQIAGIAETLRRTKLANDGQARVRVSSASRSRASGARNASDRGPSSEKHAARV